MWFLYIFGDNIEDYLGHFKYVLFYVTCGLIAMGTQVVIFPYSNLPNKNLERKRKKINKKKLDNKKSQNVKKKVKNSV